MAGQSEDSSDAKSLPPITSTPSLNRSPPDDSLTRKMALMKIGLPESAYHAGRVGASDPAHTFKAAHTNNPSSTSLPFDSYSPKSHSSPSYQGVCHPNLPPIYRQPPPLRGILEPASSIVEWHREIARKRRDDETKRIARLDAFGVAKRRPASTFLVFKRIADIERLHRPLSSATSIGEQIPALVDAYQQLGLSRRDEEEARTNVAGGATRERLPSVHQLLGSASRTSERVYAEFHEGSNCVRQSYDGITRTRTSTSRRFPSNPVIFKPLTVTQDDINSYGYTSLTSRPLPYPPPSASNQPYM